MRLQNGTAVLSLVFTAITGCSAESSPDVEGSEAALGEATSSRPIVCEGTYRFEAAEDNRQPEQAFRVTLNPGAALRLGLKTTWETFTATARLASGGKARSVVSTYEKSRNGVIANLGDVPRTYDVVIKRTEVERGEETFHLSCYPIAHAPIKTHDRAMCAVGEPCVKWKFVPRLPDDGEPAQTSEAGTCSTEFESIGIGDPEGGSRAIGFCH